MFPSGLRSFDRPEVSIVRSIALAILVGAASMAPAFAQEARVRFVFRSGTIGFFEHAVVVRGPEANRLSSPSPADLKPYLVAAQKALAEREGYSERLYGSNHFTLASGKLVESSVTDASGRMMYTSRDPVENRARPPRVVTPVRGLEAGDAPEPVVGFAPVSGRGRRRAPLQMKAFPFMRQGH